MRLVGYAPDSRAAGPVALFTHPSVLCHLDVRPLPADTDADQLLECHVRLSAEQQLSTNAGPRSEAQIGAKIVRNKR